MGQITIYLDSNSEKILRRSAKQKKLSVSKYVRILVREKNISEWPEEIIDSVGTWSDYPMVTELRAGYGDDMQRNKL
jgi:hypothetical protein